MRLKLFLIIFILATTLSNYALAKNDQNIPVAFIDRDIIISEALSVKSIRAQLDDKRAALQQDFAAREEE